MIRKKRLKKYLDKRWEGMMVSLSILSASPDREAVHELRLQAKKLKAMELLSGVHKHHFTQALKPMIQQAGDTRAAELNLQTLEGRGYQNPALKQELLTVSENGYASMRKNKEEYTSAISTVRKKWEKELDDISEQKIISFFIETVGELNAAFGWYMQEKELHENRKNLKHLLYAYRFLPKRLWRKFGFNEKYLDCLQEQIGAWHDLEMALVLLEQKEWQQEPVYALIKKEQEEVYAQIRKEAKAFHKKVRIDKTIFDKL